MQKNQKNQKSITGIIKRHADGFGFLIPDDIEEEDVYIPKHFMVGIMTNDRLLVKVIGHKGDNRTHGEVLKVMSRGSKNIVGRIKTLNDQWKIIPDESKAWGFDLKIKTADSLKSKDDDLVHVEITNYPGEGTPFTGKVIEVIGNAEDPLNDLKRVLRTLNVPTEFSQKTLTEVAPLDENPEPSEYKNRKDLKNISLITIDGATAKDFDDAVYTEITTTGFRLLVAIADVSHYVKPNTALDKDAYERGTSVYFPNFVVPMLPEKISNGLCSLKPKVPRLCVVADMIFDFQGNMTENSFYEAVMESKARVTYGEAQELIDGTEIPQLDHVKKNILSCSDLAKVLMAKRFREGSLDLNLSETILEIDAAGNPVDVQKSERLFAHKLIEELMLAANVAVATFLESKEIPSIYRIHEDPSPEDIKLLEIYLFNLGAKIHLKSNESGKLQKKLTKAIEKFENHTEGQIISLLTLRSLSQAKYSTNNIGHFGLGFQTYTHFTSPIRRYPDLIVHRLLKSQILGDKSYQTVAEDELSTSANMLSACEQRAVKCERQFYSIKKSRFMEKFIDKEFKGLISSVTRFGIFILLREFDIDGLVRLENLGNDRWVFDENNLKLVGNRSKKVFSIGQWVNIIVTGTNVELGQIDFNLVEQEKIKLAPSTEFDSAPSRSDSFSKSRRNSKNSESRGNRSDRTDRSTRTKETDKDKNYGKNKEEFRGRKFESSKTKEETSRNDKNDKYENKKTKSSFKESLKEKKAKLAEIQKRKSIEKQKASTPTSPSSTSSNKLTTIVSMPTFASTTNPNANFNNTKVGSNPSKAAVPHTPKYKSLSDYLDKKKQEGSKENKGSAGGNKNNKETKENDNRTNKSTQKSKDKKSIFFDKTNSRNKGKSKSKSKKR